MDATFNSSFKQGNRTMPVVRKILGMAFFQVANSEDDMHRNTDLICDTTLGKLRVSVRIRTCSEYNPYFKNQFTLCCGRNSGLDAEYQKIKQGYGDYIFYGFEDETGKNLRAWFIGDLSLFRKWRNTGKWTFRHNPKNEDDPKLGYLLRDGKGVGTVEKVQRTDWKTGEPYYDYFYAYDRRLVTGHFVIAYYDREEEGKQ